MKEKAQNIINQEAIELVEEPLKPENKVKSRGVKNKGPSPQLLAHQSQVHERRISVFKRRYQRAYE